MTTVPLPGMPADGKPVTVEARPIINSKMMEELAQSVMLAIAMTERLDKSDDGPGKMLGMIISAHLTSICILVREELLSRDAMEAYIAREHGRMGLEIFTKILKSYNMTMNEQAKTHGHYYEQAK